VAEDERGTGVIRGVQVGNRPTVRGVDVELYGFDRRPSTA
jgi:hypothetical protein